MRKSTKKLNEDGEQKVLTILETMEDLLNEESESEDDDEE